MYSVRSAISHGDKLLRGDLDIEWGLHPIKENERRLVEQLSLVTRIVLLNWLRKSAADDLLSIRDALEAAR